jgi:hypothetical protein
MLLLPFYGVIITVFLPLWRSRTWHSAHTLLLIARINNSYFLNIVSWLIIVTNIMQYFVLCVKTCHLETAQYSLTLFRKTWPKNGFCALVNFLVILPRFSGVLRMFRNGRLIFIPAQVQWTQSSSELRWPSQAHVAGRGRPQSDVTYREITECLLVLSDVKLLRLGCRSSACVYLQC